MKQQKTQKAFAKTRLIFITLLFGAFIQANAEKIDVKKYYNNCVACHGAEGHGMELIKAPQIAGLPAWYLEAQLIKFKEGHRGAHKDDVSGLQMRPMSRMLPDEKTIKAVAQYISEMKPKAPVDTLEPGDPEKGKALYAVCVACHGDKAQGNDLLKAPTLQHHSDWYIKAQLVKFKAGIRGTNENDITGGQMRPMAMTLADDQAMLDVIAYIRQISKQ